MGCGSSKDENPDAIKSEMKKTLIPSYDELFEKIGNILEAAEKLRAGLGENTDTMNELANLELLKEGDFSDSIQAWLWSVSANCDGKITSSNLKIDEAKPYVSLDLGNTYVECYKFQECLKDYIATCLEGPETLAGLVTDIVALADQAKDFPSTAQSDAKNAGLNPLQAAKAAANTVSNIKTTASGVPKLKNVLEIVKKACADLKLVLPNVPHLIMEADAVGEIAHKEGKKTPHLCMHFSKKEKRTKEELEILHKQKEEQEKKKKKKKTNKKEKKEQH